MTPEQFKRVKDQYRTEPVLFFFDTDHEDTGDVIATSYTRDEMAAACVAAIPLSEFAFEWNDGGFEAIPEISTTWVAVSLNASAKGGGSYNAQYEKRVKGIINKQ